MLIHKVNQWKKTKQELELSVAVLVRSYKLSLVVGGVCHCVLSLITTTLSHDRAIIAYDWTLLL